MSASPCADFLPSADSYAFKADSGGFAEHDGDFTTEDARDNERDSDYEKKY